MAKKTSQNSGELIKHVINTLSEYIDLVNTIHNKEQGEPWFRGHSSAQYLLTPGVLRDTHSLVDARGYKVSKDTVINSGHIVGGNYRPEKMLESFKRKAVPFLNDKPKNDFEWLFIMQHHGVPTRLIDWTTNAMVALYFAIMPLSPNRHTSTSDAGEQFLSEDDEYRDDGSAIFVINPKKINNKLHNINYPVNISEEFDKYSHYVTPMNNTRAEFPICITAPHITPRIRAQSGMFTLHGSKIESLDSYQVLRPLIRKIFVPHSQAIKIRNELRNFGVTTSYIFPDLEGVCREISEEELWKTGLRNSKGK